jgi:hypothetical protein
VNSSTFTALVGREFVEVADDLDALLAILAEIHDVIVNEEIAVWRGGHLIVVIRPAGSRLWIRPERRVRC